MNYTSAKEHVTANNCIFIYLVAFLSSFHWKRSKRCNELAYELKAICLQHQDGGIPLSAFSNDTTSELDGLFSTLSLHNAEHQAGKLRIPTLSYWFDLTWNQTRVYISRGGRSYHSFICNIVVRTAAIALKFATFYLDLQWD